MIDLHKIADVSVFFLRGDRRFPTLASWQGRFGISYRTEELPTIYFTGFQKSFGTWGEFDFAAHCQAFFAKGIIIGSSV